MKTLRFCFLLLLLFPPLLFSQWVIQSAGTTSNLYDVQFVGKQSGWIVGHNWSAAQGTLHATYNTDLFRTTDGGATWSKKSLSGVVVWKIHFQSTTVGWVAGETDGRRNLIMKTSDGGSSWVVQDSGKQGTYIASVRFVDPLNGWAVGAPMYLSSDSIGTIYRTADGGATWVSMSSPVRALNDIFFVDTQRGYAVGQNGAIIRSTDGGSSWKEVYKTSEPLRRAFFVGRDSGWAVGGIAGGEAKIRTTDGGETWLSTVVTGSSLHGLWFADSKNGWTVGGANAGLVIERTTNGGVSWEKQPHSMGNLGYFEGVCMTDVNEGWIVGEKGMILKTSNGGVTSVGGEGNNVPSEFALLQNYPNPFNPGTAISYQLPAASHVSLTITDVLGRKVSTLVDDLVGAGTHTVNWDGRNSRGAQQPSGVYFYTLRLAGNSVTKRMVLMK